MDHYSDNVDVFTRDYLPPLARMFAAQLPACEVKCATLDDGLPGILIRAAHLTRGPGTNGDGPFPLSVFIYWSRRAIAVFLADPESQLARYEDALAARLLSLGRHHAVDFLAGIQAVAGVTLIELGCF